MTLCGLGMSVHCRSPNSLEPDHYMYVVIIYNYCFIITSCDYSDNRKHLHRFSKHPLWDSSRPLENHWTRSYMLNEGPWDGELGRRCRAQNQHRKPRMRPVLAMGIGSPGAFIVTGLMQSSLGTLPGRWCVLSPAITLWFYLHPTRNAC